MNAYREKSGVVFRVTVVVVIVNDRLCPKSVAWAVPTTMRSAGGHSPPYRLVAIRVFGQSFNDRPGN
jgi:hypothetical protein